MAEGRKAPAGTPVPPTRVEVGDASDRPAAILAAWTALEALSPRTYRRPEDLRAGDRGCVVDISKDRLPWRSGGEPSRPGHALYYEVVLGAIPMDEATEDLEKAFGKNEEHSAPARQKAAIAAVLVDGNGVPLEKNSLAASSFAWALPLALQLQLHALGDWPKRERSLIEQFDKIVRRFDKDGKGIAITAEVIKETHEWLVKEFGLPEHLVEPPTFALRVYQHLKAKNPPEVSLLNSFYLGDLARAADLLKQNAAPPGLRRYLGMDMPERTFDLFADRTVLEESVAPAAMPAARWPSPGGHPLVLLQQAAVNLARAELAGTEGIFAVNGPPGTGKTTLLRDVVAACVLDRALAMCAFDDPEQAFTASGQKMPVSEKAFFHFYTLAPSLKGHEILVASSNNKAVENVSRELPAAKAVGRTTEQLSYFRSVSDLVHGGHDLKDAAAQDDGDEADPIRTWGLIAAVLGNAKNRFAFQQAFWWHDELSFRLYLKAAKGDPVVREIKDPATGKIERKTPAIVQTEQPPSPQSAKSNWRRTRERFMALKEEIHAEIESIEATRRHCVQLTELRQQMAAQETALAQMTAQREQLELTLSHREDQVHAARAEDERCAADMQRHRKIRPGWLARLFRTERWKIWSTANEPLRKARAASTATLQSAEQTHAETKRAIDAQRYQIGKLEERLAGPRAKAQQLSQIIESRRLALGDRIVDEQFFNRGHSSSNLTTPWLPDSLHRKREDLFIAALAVHRAFIDASAQKLLHNLSVLMDVFLSGPPPDEARRKLLGELWSTLFMVVPVLSTTFASVERMLGELPPGSIGWLLIDEAGQAVPQAAVGAIMRARRTLVVGDPLQIPPVMSLPERLNHEICKFFNVEKLLWSAPESSAQTLADRASRFQAAFRSDRGPRRVGAPLLVHRRCQEPMFGISNRMAYDGQMVHAPGPRDAGPIGATLGPSTWFSVDGEADSKWCPAEGELVLKILDKIADAGVTQPDLFIITPFRIVAQEMLRLLENESALLDQLRVDVKWMSDRVGTIHTVQGREANSVILVLGAPTATQHLARSWAASTPNILNVAVSRAKQNLYVVGSYGAWSAVGHARELATMPCVKC